MLIKYVSKEDIENALATVNEKYDGNVILNRFDRADSRTFQSWNVTLKVASSKGKGARRGFSGKRMASACWHVYGEFMDALPDSAVIVTQGVIGYRMGREQIGRVNRSPGDAWEDWNIGSIYSPLYYSEACDCNE